MAAGVGRRERIAERASGSENGVLCWRRLDRSPTFAKSPIFSIIAFVRSRALLASSGGAEIDKSGFGLTDLGECRLRLLDLGYGLLFSHMEAALEFSTFG
jgi:hypothetical protein